MNIKFISSAGYQLWASEGVITIYRYIDVCSPDMTAYEHGLRHISVGLIEQELSVYSVEEVPDMEAELKDVKPEVSGEVIGPPEVKVF